MDLYNQMGTTLVGEETFKSIKFAIASVVASNSHTYVETGDLRIQEQADNNIEIAQTALAVIRLVFDIQERGQ